MRKGPLFGVAIVLGAVMAASSIALASAPTGTSSREETIRHLLDAVRTRDEAGMRRLLTEDARFLSSFDVVDDEVSTADLDRFLGACRPSRTSEALGVVAVRFDCARDPRSEFIVDFSFCGDRIDTISWPEAGRRALWPLPYHLAARLLDTDRCSAAGTA